MKLKYLGGMIDFLDRDARLLRRVQELVDLQPLHQLAVVGLDQHRLRAARLVEHVLPPDVVQLGVDGGLLSFQSVELVFLVGLLLLERLIRKLRLLHVLSLFSQLRLQGTFVLLLAVDAGGEVGVLRLQGVGWRKRRKLKIGSRQK